MAAYFRGKTMVIQVGFSPGGGYDTFSRLIAKYLPAHLPGSPNVAVQNLPGNGGLRGLVTTMNSKPDGLTIGTINPRWVVAAIVGDDVQGFNLDQLNPLGSPSASRLTQALYVRRDVATTWDGVKALGRDLIIGEVAPGAQTSTGISWAAELGAPLKFVYGYGGSSEVMAAIDRGEVEGTTYGRPELVDRLYPAWKDIPSYIVPVAWWGADPSSDPSFTSWLQELQVPMPPSIKDLVSHTDDQASVLDTADAVNNAMSRFAAVPPGVPADILATLRKAYSDTIHDPEFVSAVQVAGYDVNFASPDEIQQAITAGKKLAQNADDRALFKAIASGS